MQRAELDAVLDALDHFGIDPHGYGEPLPTVYDAVPHGPDLGQGADHAVLGVGEGREHIADRGAVVGHGVLTDVRGQAGGSVLEDSPLPSVDGDPVRDPVSQDAGRLHVDELVLQGGTAAVDNENDHDVCSLACVCALSLPGVSPAVSQQVAGRARICLHARRSRSEGLLGLIEYTLSPHQVLLHALDDVTGPYFGL